MPLVVTRGYLRRNACLTALEKSVRTDCKSNWFLDKDRICRLINGVLSANCLTVDGA